MPQEKIVTIGSKADEKFLRKKTIDFDFKKWSRPEISKLIVTMKRMMREANGIGLSANQIGLTFKVFVARVPDAHGAYKLYAVFNPKIEKVSSEKSAQEEGCLSVPGVYGSVPRSERIEIWGFDRNGKPLHIKAWGLLARVFQHEIDHLDGKLFLDRTKQIYSAKMKDQNEKGVIVMENKKAARLQ